MVRGQLNFKAQLIRSNLKVAGKCMFHQEILRTLIMKPISEIMRMRIDKNTLEGNANHKNATI